MVNKPISTTENYHFKMQLNLFFDKPKNLKKPYLKLHLMAYKSLDIKQRINFKSWFFDEYNWYKNDFKTFINESLILANINNNKFYTDNLK